MENNKKFEDENNKLLNEKNKYISEMNKLKEEISELNINMKAKIVETNNINNKYIRVKECLNDIMKIYGKKIDTEVIYEPEWGNCQFKIKLYYSYREELDRAFNRFNEIQNLINSNWL